MVEQFAVESSRAVRVQKRARFMHPEFSEVEFGGRKVWLARKPIKNMYVRVKPPEGRVEVTAPLRLPLKTVEKFLTSRGAWIDKAIAKVRAQAAETAEQAAQQALQESQNPRDPHIIEGAPSTSSRESQLAAKAIISKQLETLLPHCERIVGKSPSAISLRSMKTRWGSCTPSTGRIRLNLQLAYMPEKFLEYVLIHELTHLRAGGHGARFQHYMDEYLPNWRTLRKEINTFVIV
jgi:predicted metal-dependent hydrolase